VLTAEAELPTVRVELEAPFTERVAAPVVTVVSRRVLAAFVVDRVSEVA